MTIQCEQFADSSYYKINQLDNGNVVFGQGQKKLTVFSITGNTFKKEFEIDNIHEDKVRARQPLSGSRYATGGDDKVVKIWNLTSPYTEQSKEPVKVFREHEREVNNMKYFREKVILLTADYSGKIIVRNAVTYETISLFQDLAEVAYMVDYDSERFMRCHSKIIEVINITTKEIEKKKDLSNVKGIYTFDLYKLRDNKTFLCKKGDYSRYFYLFNFEDDTTSSYVVDRRGVENIMFIDDETFAGKVTNYDNSNYTEISLWKY